MSLRQWLSVRVSTAFVWSQDKGPMTDVFQTVANFAAYTFAPAILVTPLGAMSVIIGSVYIVIRKCDADQAQSHPCILPPG